MPPNHQVPIEQAGFVTTYITAGKDSDRRNLAGELALLFGARPDRLIAFVAFKWGLFKRTTLSAHRRRAAPHASAVPPRLVVGLGLESSLGQSIGAHRGALEWNHLRTYTVPYRLPSRD